MNFEIREIVKATSGKLLKGDPRLLIKGISTDSRTIKKGELFVALSGRLFKALPDSHLDGHDFLKMALEKGAIGAVIAKNIDLGFPVLIRVNDTLDAYQAIARYWRQKFNLPVIAITGSNGKTTTKNMAVAILSEKYKVLSSEESFNNQVGVPSTILRLRSNHQVLVLEMGTNMPGEIEILSNIAKPTVAVITNIGPTHLEKFKTIQGVAKEKKSIFKRVRIRIMGRDGLEPMEQNKEVARKIGRILGLSKQEIVRGLKKFKPAKMRLERIKRKGVLIINDAYNANPISMKYALKVLDKENGQGRKIAVLADMLELGACSDKYHKEIKDYLPKSISILITVGQKAKLIGGDYSYRYPHEASRRLRSLLRPGDIVLLKGSRAMRLEKIISSL